MLNCVASKKPSENMVSVAWVGTGWGSPDFSQMLSNDFVRFWRATLSPTVFIFLAALHSLLLTLSSFYCTLSHCCSTSLWSYVFCFYCYCHCLCWASLFWADVSYYLTWRERHRKVSAAPILTLQVTSQCLQSFKFLLWTKAHHLNPNIILQQITHLIVKLLNFHERNL